LHAEEVFTPGGRPGPQVCHKSATPMLAALAAFD
jgi:hypothetical protein